MRRTKNVLIVFFALLTVVGSFFLPAAVQALQDSSVTDNVREVDSDEVELSLISELTMPQKLSVAGDSSATSLEVASGKYMDKTDAEEVLYNVLDSIGLPTSDYTGEFLVDVYPDLRVDAGGNALILWTATMNSNMADVTITIDDETEKILAIDICAYPYSAEYESYSGSKTYDYPDPLWIDYKTEESDFYYLATDYVEKYLGLVVESMSVEGNDMLVYIWDGDGYYKMPLTIYGGYTLHIGINV